MSCSGGKTEHFCATCKTIGFLPRQDYERLIVEREEESLRKELERVKAEGIRKLELIAIAEAKDREQKEREALQALHEARKAARQCINCGGKLNSRDFAKGRTAHLDCSNPNPNSLSSISARMIQDIRQSLPTRRRYLVVMTMNLTTFYCVTFAMMQMSQNFFVELPNSRLRGLELIYPVGPVWHSSILEYIASLIVWALSLFIIGSTIPRRLTLGLKSLSTPWTSYFRIRYWAYQMLVSFCYVFIVNCSTRLHSSPRTIVDITTYLVATAVGIVVAYLGMFERQK